MKIVIGRGRNRKVYELPNGAVFKTAEKDNPAEYRQAMDEIHGLLGT